MVRTRMAEADDEQPKLGPAVQVAGQTGQRAETLDHLQRLSIEAAVARIEATVARTEANVVHLDRGVSDTPGDVKDVRDRLARLEANVAQLPGRGFVISAVLITIAVLTAVSLFHNKLMATLGLTY
jgi:hypothetical protein